MKPKYSIIFLIEDENQSFPQFFRLIYNLFLDRRQAFEIIVVANDKGHFVTTQLSDNNMAAQVTTIIVFHQRVPSSVCINTGMNESRGDFILTLGSYQELPLQDYKILLDSLSPEVDLAIPFRKKRVDPLLNKLHSKLLNLVLKVVIGEKIHDIGCQAKLFRRQVLEDIDLYGNMFRYLPSLAAQKGFKIREVECEQRRAENSKVRFYHPRRYLDRLVEIINLFFSTHFSKKPLRFFSLVGSAVISLGIVSLLYITFQKVVFGVPVGNRPLLMAAIISIVAGAQFASFGLLGEIISFVHGRSRESYTIEKII